MKTPKVSVVIPSWNSEKQMRQNLPYVYRAAKRVKAEIIIVDDKSAYDDSWGYLQTQKKQVKSYLNKKNLGFSATVNKGVSKAKGDVIMLLNTDVRPSVDCFERCLKLFEDPTVFAVGFNSGEAWMGGEWQGGLFHHFKVEPNKDNKNMLNPSLWASGGQAAFDKAKWELLGGMNTLYKPFYWEDTDLGYSAWKRGWRVLWSPECKVVHDHQKSVIANNFSREYVMGIAQRNQFLFIWKNISDSKLLLSHLVSLPYFLIKYPLAVLRALALLPHALRERAKHRPHWVRRDQDIISLWAR